MERGSRELHSNAMWLTKLWLRLPKKISCEGFVRGIRARDPCEGFVPGIRAGDSCEWISNEKASWNFEGSYTILPPKNGSYQTLGRSFCRGLFSTKWMHPASFKHDFLTLGASIF